MQVTISVSWDFCTPLNFEKYLSGGYFPRNCLFCYFFFKVSSLLPPDVEKKTWPSPLNLCEVTPLYETVRFSPESKELKVPRNLTNVINPRVRKIAVYGVSLSELYVVVVVGSRFDFS